METEQQELSTVVNSEDQVLSEAGSLADRGQWKEAISLLKNLEQVSPLSVKVLSKLAYYYSQDGAYDDAINLYKNLSQRQPSEGKWFYYLGFQYQQKKKWPEAIASYERSSDLAPRWSLPSLRLGDAYQEAGEPGKALEIYHKGIWSFPRIGVVKLISPHMENSVVRQLVCS
jgi:tetratricopeptide (TPR) repeat protein